MQVVIIIETLKRDFLYSIQQWQHRNKKSSPFKKTLRKLKKFLCKHQKGTINRLTFFKGILSNVRNNF